MEYIHYTVKVINRKNHIVRIYDIAVRANSTWNTPGKVIRAFYRDYPDYDNMGWDMTIKKGK